jgi:hypothetical protein
LSYSVVTKIDRQRPSCFSTVKDYFLYTFASQTQMADVIFKLMHCSLDFAIGVEGKRQINTGFYKKELGRVKFNT